MEEYEYAVVLEFDDEIGEYVALVPALPGCTSQGKTKEEALANVREAIRGHIETFRHLGHRKRCGICTTKVEQASRLFKGSLFPAAISLTGKNRGAPTTSLGDVSREYRSARKRGGRS
ncbi:MAG TPA: type II toxin-antitoxin system HicB family antitoxin [Dehalococcoidia bacterium]|nr:type II toxin-antitoxin system HicB family antitoxin [Dehalococcoidia bacterium]